MVQSGGDPLGGIRRALSDFGDNASRVFKDIGNGNWNNLNPVRWGLCTVHMCVHWSGLHDPAMCALGALTARRGRTAGAAGEG